MADKQQPPLLPPPSAPFPGSTTPGWNDPPPLQYNANASGRPRLNLNKRVAFPLGATDATPKPTAIVQPNFSPAAITTNVAVVHPMPQIQIPPSTVMAPPPVATAAPVSNYVGFPTGGELQQQQQPQPIVSHTNPNLPTMFVPALPRQTNESTEASSNELSGFQGFPSTPSVQHL